jgi:hypothetical protein
LLIIYHYYNSDSKSLPRKKQTKMTNAERHEECLQTLAAVNIEAQQGKPLSPEIIAHIKHVLETCKIKTK